jgi:hypothetical protein
MVGFSSLTFGYGAEANFGLTKGRIPYTSFEGSEYPTTLIRHEFGRA